MRRSRQLLRWVLVLLSLLTILSMCYAWLYRDFTLRGSSTHLSGSLPETAVVVTGDAGRIRFALQLMDQGLIRRLYVIGSGTNPQQFARHYALSAGLLKAFQDGDIVISNRSTSTLENAIEARCLLARQSDAARIVLITSGYHMARASLIFDRAMPSGGPEIVRMVSDPGPGWASLRKSEWRKFLASWFITLGPQPFWVTGPEHPCAGL